MIIGFDVALYEFIKAEFETIKSDSDRLEDIAKYAPSNTQTEFLEYMGETDIVFAIGFPRESFKNPTVVFHFASDNENDQLVGTDLEIQGIDFKAGTDYAIVHYPTYSGIELPYNYVKDVVTNISDIYEVELNLKLGTIKVSPPFTDTLTITYNYPENLEYIIKSGFGVSFRFEIYSANSIATSWIYSLLKYILLQKRSEIQNLIKLHEQLLVGQEILPRPELMPQFMYAKIITLQGKFFEYYVENTFANLKNNDIIIQGE